MRDEWLICGPWRAQSRHWGPQVTEIACTTAAGGGLPAIAVVNPTHGQQDEGWPASLELNGLALSLASQLPQRAKAGLREIVRRLASLLASQLLQKARAGFRKVVRRPAPSLASQLPQVPISSRHQHDGDAACGSGLARDDGGRFTASTTGSARACQPWKGGTGPMAGTPPALPRQFHLSFRLFANLECLPGVR